MKIYTYYEDIGFSTQHKMLDMWKLSWAKHGYEPIVLGLDDAKSHPYFNTLNIEMRKIFKHITGNDISDYGMSCWFRWLAYATQSDECFYVSDYDVINTNFHEHNISPELHLLDAHVPCFASGTPKEFERLCRLFVEISNERIGVLSKQADHYHDQEFFQYNFRFDLNPEGKKYLDKYKLKLSRNRHEMCGSYDPITEECIAGPYLGRIDAEGYRVFHVSHENCKILRAQYPSLKEPNYTQPELRLHIIQKLKDRYEF